MSLRAMHEVSKQSSVQESSLQLIEEQRQTIEQQKQTISELSSQISLLKSEMQKLADKNAQLNEADEVQEIQKENAELKKQNEQMKQEYADIGAMISNFRQQMEWISKQKESAVNNLINRCDSFDAVISELKAEKTLFGGIKGVSWDQWEQLLSAAVLLRKAKEDCSHVLIEIAKAEDAKKPNIRVKVQRIKEEYGTRD